MTYTDLIFDLYGTLVDIHTEESDTVWEKTALYLSFHGAHFTGSGLKAAFLSALKEEKTNQRLQFTYPDIPFEQIMAQVLRASGVKENVDTLAISGAKAVGLASLYMHTNLTPWDQEKADPSLLPGLASEGCTHYEFEGWDWKELSKSIADL